MDYILGKKEKGCIFCRKPKEKKDRTNLLLHRGKLAFVMMNKFPYNNGHLLVAPARHIADFTETSEDEMLELVKLVREAQRALSLTLHPHGFNVGLNFGRCAGAGLPGHMHIHVVPRWNGDTNFMPMLAEVRVLPEHLETMYDRLQPLFDAILSEIPALFQNEVPLDVAFVRGPLETAGLDGLEQARHGQDRADGITEITPHHEV